MSVRSSTRIDGRPILVGLLLTLLLVAGCRPSEAPLVGVASSLRLAMPQLLQDFAAQPGGEGLDATYAGSGTLRQQAEAGAPFVAVVLLGDHADRLIAAGEAVAETRTVVARNRLVLIGAAQAPPVGFADLGGLPDAARVALGDPGSVPVGTYARAALERLGVWRGLEGHLVQAGSVAAVLSYVERGEADYGVVYLSDLHGARNAVLLAEADPSWAPTPEVVAAVGSSGGAVGRAFVRFLASPGATAVLERFGFDPVGPEGLDPRGLARGGLDPGGSRAR